MSKSNESPFLSAGIPRRDFLALTTAATAGLAAGCATNPVTGRREAMFYTEADEIAIDKKWSPHQFSADYGASLDDALNQYVASVGNKEAELTHRPQMPYNFRVVNAVVVNGYTFPAGSVAIARGLMLEMENEAELAAVLGHELGHVNARHAARQMTKGAITNLALLGAAAYVGYEKPEYAELAIGLGGIGASALLARYSRGHEREADRLGMLYASKAGHNPSGMIGLMDVLMSLSQRSPGVVELIFATHPMSTERYKTASDRMDTEYAQLGDRDKGRERYMDNTARLRAKKDAIHALQKGERSLMQSRYGEAEEFFSDALKKEPRDYAGLLLMAKCCLAQDKKPEARRYAEKAIKVYPEEPQAQHVAGMANLESRRFDPALDHFARYEKMLPGNANTMFLKGFCYENMGQKEEAAAEYMKFRASGSGGNFAEHASSRLVEWGYVPAPQ